MPPKYKTTLSATTTQRNVNYFQHFPKSFINSYDEALQDITDDDVLARLHPWNCEWLKRPRVACSEYAATVTANLDILRSYKGKVFSKSLVEFLDDTFKDVLPACQRLNNKDKKVKDKATKDDLSNLMKLVSSSNTRLEPLIRECFNAAGAMYSIATHTIVLQTLLWNPEQYADKLEDNRGAKQFKENPTKANLRRFLENEILPTEATKKESSSTKRRTAWSDEETTSESSDTDDNFKSKRVNARKRYKATTSTDETSEDDNQPSKKRARSSLRKPSKTTSKGKRNSKPGKHRSDNIFEELEQIVAKRNEYELDESEERNIFKTQPDSPKPTKTSLSSKPSKRGTPDGSKEEEKTALATKTKKKTTNEKGKGKEEINSEEKKESSTSKVKETTKTKPKEPLPKQKGNTMDTSPVKKTKQQETKPSSQKMKKIPSTNKEDTLVLKKKDKRPPPESKKKDSSSTNSNSSSD